MSNFFPDNEPLLPGNVNQGQHVEVPVKGTKAIVGAALAAVVAIATGLTELIPDPTLGLVCKVIVLVVGSAGTAFGVYQTVNAPRY